MPDTLPTAGDTAVYKTASVPTPLEQRIARRQRIGRS
jgi:hypothetical protein